MGSCCSKGFSHEEVSLDAPPYLSQPSVNNVFQTESEDASDDVCIAPTPAAALLLDALLRQRPQYMTPFEMLQDLINSDSVLCPKPEGRDGEDNKLIYSVHHSGVCSPTRYLKTARPVQYIQESSTVYPKTHRGMVSVESLKSPSASPFGPLSHFVTARSHTLSTKRVLPQCFRIATDSQHSDGDYSYSETVWSRIDSQNGSEWDFDNPDSMGAFTNRGRTPQNFHAAEYTSLRPMIPSLNMEIVAALAARENAYHKNRIYYPVVSPVSSTTFRSERLPMEDDCSAPLTHRLAATERHVRLNPPKVAGLSTTRTHRFVRTRNVSPTSSSDPIASEVAVSPRFEEQDCVTPLVTSRVKSVHFESDRKVLTERSAERPQNICGSSNGPSILCTYREVSGNSAKAIDVSSLSVCRNAASSDNTSSDPALITADVPVGVPETIGETSSEKADYNGLSSTVPPEQVHCFDESALSDSESLTSKSFGESFVTEASTCSTGAGSISHPVPSFEKGFEFESEIGPSICV